jgi:endo-1,4-beta-mannosidase
MILAPCNAAELPKVRIAGDTRGFALPDGRRFVPFGVNYFRPGTGWAPQVWKQFDEEATRRDFVRLRSVGVNCVRVFLTFGSFMVEPGVLAEEGLAKFDRFLALAEEAGIYVHPTGPDHWEGIPEWARGDRIADERVLTALEGFWTRFTARYRGRGVLWAYDLLNEPEVGWDTPVLREKWNRWLTVHYADAAGLEKAWGMKLEPGQWGAIRIPPREDAPGDPVLRDFQRFRESVAEEWTHRQVEAIRIGDPGALVTVGLIQWSVPVVLAGAFHYSGFRPERQARFLDFMEVHFYPLADGAYQYSGREAEEKNLAYLESVVAAVARPGKPVVIAEYGWYGGGRPRHMGDIREPATEEQQSAWNRQVVETTAGLACGWLHWGLYDQPEARDVTEYIGLFKADGTIKAWGRTFSDLSGRLQSLPQTRDRGTRPAPDWEACLVDGRARREFQARYLEAWKTKTER